MQTPKKFIQDLYSDININKSYLMKGEPKQVKLYADVNSFVTNSKAIQKISLESNSLPFKPARERSDSKTMYFQNSLKLKKKQSDTKAMLVTQTIPISTFYYPRESMIDQRRFSTPFSTKNSDSKGLTQMICQTPTNKKKLEHSPIKTNDSHHTVDDSRGRRSYSSVKKGKYLTVVSRMPISKKIQKVSIF